MTNEEAIKVLNMVEAHGHLVIQAKEMAIKALSVPEREKGTLEKIKAEIREEAEFAYADFEKYKVECLGIEEEYVEDELPDDDFRYGMERAIEIINKNTVAVPEREKGEWIIREDNTSFVKQLPRRWVECPCCGWSFSYDRIRDDYCSKCGADMRR